MVTKKTVQRLGFKTGEYIVYPAHGVGLITSIEEQEVAGLTLELFVISFEQDKLTLRVPVAKIKSVGMRKLAEEDEVKKALETVTGRARVKRTMWSRRAQEYEAKINSGDLIAISEVVRDLFRSDDQPEQSYSERQLFEQAMDRMSREVGVGQQADPHRGRPADRKEPRQVARAAVPRPTQQMLPTPPTPRKQRPDWSHCYRNRKGWSSDRPFFFLGSDCRRGQRRRVFDASEQCDGHEHRDTRNACANHHPER